ncbi:hypothetical protein [Falsiroseomonas sp. HW251]|uniref:hypothetical protein n=1 Tax=Falsiroseomonas sp. HW251 TaxID=3390998 RepID=UPI003D30F90E
MLTVERVAPPPEVAALLARAADQAAMPAWRIAAQRLAGLGLVVAIVFGAIGLLDLLFGIMDRAGWLVLIIGASLMLVPVAVLSVGGEIRAARARQGAAAALKATLAGGQVSRFTLERDAAHWFVEHEHGVIHVCAADAGRTLYLDLSSVADDPRWEDWYRSGRIHRRTWRWYATDDGVLAGFVAEGEPLAPNSFQQAAGRYDPDDGGALFEWLGSPGDGDVIARPFAKVDAFIRKALPPS